MKSYICFRFDIDTHKCLRDGVPNLLQLGEKYKRKFTFFLNCGRSVNKAAFIQKFFSNPQQEQQIVSLSAFQKLGLKDYLQIIIQNPSIASSYPKQVVEILKQGHELGLHGGMNHQDWADNADMWEKEKIEKEVQWGLNNMYNIILKEKVKGFASPGWKTSQIVNEVLQELNFQYVADIHTNEPLQQIKKSKGLTYIPTNIVGEPGGVGYLEYCRASGMSDDETVNDFKAKLKDRKKIAVMYDHPYYAGTQEIILLEKLIKIGIQMDYTFVTLKQLSEKL